MPRIPRLTLPIALVSALVFTIGIVGSARYTPVGQSMGWAWEEQDTERDVPDWESDWQEQQPAQEEEEEFVNGEESAEQQEDQSSVPSHHGSVIDPPAQEEEHDVPDWESDWQEQWKQQPAQEEEEFVNGEESAEQQEDQSSVPSHHGSVIDPPAPRVSVDGCKADEFCSHGVEFDRCPESANAGVVRRCATGICYACPSVPREPHSWTPMPEEDPVRDEKNDSHSQGQGQHQDVPHGDGTNVGSEEAREACLRNYPHIDLQGCMGEYELWKQWQERQAQPHLANLVPVGDITNGAYDFVVVVPAGDKLALAKAPPGTDYDFTAIFDPVSREMISVAQAPDVPGGVRTGLWVSADGSKLAHLAYFRMDSAGNGGNHWLVYDVESSTWSRGNNAGNTASTEAGPFGGSQGFHCYAPGVTSCYGRAGGSNIELRDVYDECTDSQMTHPSDRNGYSYSCQSSRHIEAWRDGVLLGRVDSLPEHYATFLQGEVGSAWVSPDGRKIYVWLAQNRDSNGWLYERLWSRAVVN